MALCFLGLCSLLNRILCGDFEASQELLHIHVELNVQLIVAVHIDTIDDISGDHLLRCDVALVENFRPPHEVPIRKNSQQTFSVCFFLYLLTLFPG